MMGRLPAPEPRPRAAAGRCWARTIISVQAADYAPFMTVLRNQHRPLESAKLSTFRDRTFHKTVIFEAVDKSKTWPTEPPQTARLGHVGGR
jgi:hypothetical protein